MLLARPVLFALATCVAAAGCRPETDHVTRAVERARPHLEGFLRFERWARRATAGRSAPRSLAVLGDLVFAPVRNSPALIGAWVSLEGERSRVLALPTSAAVPVVERWVALRDRELGALRVAVTNRCPVARSAQVPVAHGSSCVLLSRGDTRADQAGITVTMAFVAEAL
jgi:hypothetical protein